MEAAELVASPQIRNQGTIGGNVSQDTRCWYYRGGWTCYRAGGNICYADTPTAINREHAIFDADRCVAVNPSDTAPALVALDAQMVIRGPERRARRQRRGLLDRPRHRHHADERAGAGRAAHRDPHPGDMAGAQFYFEKVRDRQVWDFPLVNVASAIKPNGGNIGEVAPGRQRRGGDAAAAEATSKRRSSASRATKRRRSMAGEMAVEGAQTAAAQRLQGAADAEPGEARHPGERRHGPLNVGTESVGRVGSHPHLMESVLGVAVRRRAVLRGARELHAVLGAPQAARQLRPTRSRPSARICRRRSSGTTSRARLFHWVMAASMFVLLFTAFLPVVGVQVRVGAVALDRRARADRLDPLPHHPRHVLPRLLVDLGRPEGHPGVQGGDAARVRARRARARSPASIRSATASITWRSSSPAWRRSPPAC